MRTGRGNGPNIGLVLARIVDVLAMARKGDSNILSSKLDTKDEFWRMVCEEGQEWNFVYVLPNHSGKPPEIVVSPTLQIGWVLSPTFFFAISVTAQDVAASYVYETQGTLLKHPLEDLKMPDEEFILPEK